MYTVITKEMIYVVTGCSGQEKLYKIHDVHLVAILSLYIINTHERLQDHNIHCWLIQPSGTTYSRRCEGYDTY